MLRCIGGGCGVGMAWVDGVHERCELFIRLDQLLRRPACRGRARGWHVAGDRGGWLLE